MGRHSKVLQVSNGYAEIHTPRGLKALVVDNNRQPGLGSNAMVSFNEDQDQDGITVVINTTQVFPDEMFKAEGGGAAEKVVLVKIAIVGYPPGPIPIGVMWRD